MVFPPFFISFHLRVYLPKFRKKNKVKYVFGSMKIKCVDCHSTEVVEDKHRREVYCSKCGRVLSSAPPYYDNNGKYIDYPYGVILG